MQQLGNVIKWAFVLAVVTYLVTGLVFDLTEAGFQTKSWEIDLIKVNTIAWRVGITSFGLLVIDFILATNAWLANR